MTKEQILEYFKDINLMYNESTRYDDLSRMIDELEPKTGHWIKKDGYNECSECGSHIVTEWDYCPKCGAKMR